VIIAQAFGEYIGASVVASAFQETWRSLLYYLSSLSPSTWLIVGGSLLFLSYFWLRTSQ